MRLDKKYKLLMLIKITQTIRAPDNHIANDSNLQNIKQLN